MADLMRVYLAGEIRGAAGWRDKLVSWGSHGLWSEAFVHLDEHIIHLRGFEWEE